VIHRVELARSATADLADIVEWIARNDSVENAVYVLDQIQAKTNSLAQQPERGAVPLELRSLGVDKYREVFFKPYRIIYHVKDKRVIINLIADGRRDMTALLQRRLTAKP
jgi:toxin ParE1/3/4